LRRYKRRWVVEQTNAWLGQFRRLLVRHEHLFSIYRAFFYLLMDYTQALFMKHALAQIIRGV
jgi:transposase